MTLSWILQVTVLAAKSTRDSCCTRTGLSGVAGEKIILWLILTFVVQTIKKLFLVSTCLHPMAINAFEYSVTSMLVHNFSHVLEP